MILKFALTSIVASFLMLSATTLAQAQQEPVFDSYEDMRAQLDELMMSRQIGKLMNRFGGNSDIDDEGRAELENKVRAIYPYDFKHVDLLKRDEMQNGWSQELYAYWVGLSYIYVTVLMHQREDVLVAINIKFNTDFDKMVENY